MRGVMRQVPLSYERWDGTNLAAIQAITSGLADVSGNPDGTLRVSAPDGEERAPVRLGWYVSVAHTGTGGMVIVQAPAVFGALVEPA